MLSAGGQTITMDAFIIIHITQRRSSTYMYKLPMLRAVALGCASASRVINYSTIQVVSAVAGVLKTLTNVSWSLHSGVSDCERSGQDVAL